jgi:hypothetical protein
LPAAIFATSSKSAHEVHNVTYEHLAPTRPIDAPIVVRRFLLWAAICSASAAPSFFLGLSLGSMAGMIAGIALFTVAYTVLTCTQRFERMYRQPFVRTTMYVGYGLRIFASVSLFLAVAGVPPILVVPDVFCGQLSINLAGRLGLPIDYDYAVSSSRVAHGQFETFVAVFVTTCIQGLLLNLIVFFVMAITYAAQRMFRKWPDEEGDRIRGFEVLPLARDQD